MKVLGYLLVLAIFGEERKTFYDNVKDFSIEVKKVGQLSDNNFGNHKATNEPVFTKDDIRKSNFVNKGTVAKYYSLSLRDYIVYHNVSSDEEGFVITLKHSNNSDEKSNDLESKKDANNDPTIVFIPTHEEPLKDIDEKELSSALSGYVEKVKKELGAKSAGVDALNSAEILQVDNKTNHLKVHPTYKDFASKLEELDSSNISDAKILDTNNKNVSEVKLLAPSNSSEIIDLSSINEDKISNQVKKTTEDKNLNINKTSVEDKISNEDKKLFGDKKSNEDRNSVKDIIANEDIKFIKDKKSNEDKESNEETTNTPTSKPFDDNEHSHKSSAGPSLEIYYEEYFDDSNRYDFIDDYDKELEQDE